MIGTKIHGEDRALQKIFNDDFMFSIPRYQRPYSWTTDNAAELLTDILGNIEDGNAHIDDLNPYFLGSIVLVKEEDKPESEVIDGQQRLATLIILFSVIRALLQDSNMDEDKVFANDMNKFLFQPGDSVLGLPDKPRLFLRSKDHRFFEEKIQNYLDFAELEELDSESLSDAKQNIRANALILRDLLCEKPSVDLKRLVQYILKRCYLVVVSTENLEQAYRVFSVLNARGLELSYTDILKAEIIGEIEEKKQDEYTKKWEDIEEYLGREEFEQLFAHIRTIYRKVKAKNTILEEIRTYIKPKKDPCGFMDETLEPYAEAFDTILEKAYESRHNAEEINGYLKWLAMIDNFDWIPPTILLMKNYKRQHRLLLDFLCKLERLAAGMMINRVDLNKRIERYAQLISLIEEGGDLFADDSPLELRKEERKEIISRLNGDLYWETKTRKYVLLRLDTELSGGEAEYNYRFITIEHVLPQTVAEDSEWEEWFPTEELRETYTHRLGNLVLLSKKKNSQAWRFDFKKKKETYFKTDTGISPFVLTTQVLSEDEWTPEVVERRQKELMKVLKGIWDL